MRNVLLLITGLYATSAWAQNTCATALTVTAGTYTAPEVLGTAPFFICAGDEVAAHGLWYKYTAAEDHQLTISTDLPQNIGGDTRVHIYRGTCVALVCVTGDDDAGIGELAVATAPVIHGTTYYIAFDDRWSSDGFDFEVIEAPPVWSPVSFTLAQNLPTYAMAAVDMNGDHLDDVVSPSSSSVTVQHQQADGSLVSTTIPTPVADHTPDWSMAAGDIDKNGYADLMYGDGAGATFMMAVPGGNGFTEMSFVEDIFCQRTNMVDINNDGNLDAFTCHDVDANVYFLNDGEGALSYHQGGFGTTCGNYGSIWVDYDNDRDMDCFIAKCGCDPVDLLLRNDGTLIFSSMATTADFADFHESWSSAWGDFDGDGDMDVLVGSSSSPEHKLMRNEGGFFINVTQGSGVDDFNTMSREWVTHDFNNDGYLDVLGGYRFLLGHGDMTFTSYPIDPVNGPIGDLNNDGFLDIVSDGTRIYLNDGNENHWLKLTTVGTESNGNGIGARVEITSAMGTQIREVRSGDGFEYMSSLNTHFGLGVDTEVSNVTVYWPSGQISTMTDVPADTALVIVEGAIITGVADNDAASDARIRPNPVDQSLFIDGAKELGNRNVRVFDESGRVVHRGVLRSGSLDVSMLSTGLYVLDVDGLPGLRGRFVKR